MSVDEELDAMHEAMDQLLDTIADANAHLRPAKRATEPEHETKEA
jgi:hypothetical protein